MSRNSRINSPTPKAPRNAADESARNSPRRKGKGASKPTSRRAQSELIYGFHPVLAALGNPARRKQRLMLTKEAKKSLTNEAAADSALAGDAALAGQADGATGGIAEALATSHVVARSEIDAALPKGAVHQGFLLQCAPLSAIDLEECCAPDGGNMPVVLLDQVSDPHNVGAILRSAAAFGARAVIIPERHSPNATGVLAKSASGALESVPLIRVTNLVRAMGQLKDMGYWLTGLDSGADMTLGNDTLKQPVALVLGAEGSGLRRLTRENCDSLAAIKLAGSMHSLNVSNAAAVALYQLILNK
jgi:23S rRNA (guanosine2251-2'-O)-methyltransferase